MDIQSITLIRSGKGRSIAPEYSITLHKEGKVHWKGIRGVKHLNSLEFICPDRDLSRILEDARKLLNSNIDRVYDSKERDGGSCSTLLIRVNEEEQFEFYGNFAMFESDDFEMIDRNISIDIREGYLAPVSKEGLLKLCKFNFEFEERLGVPILVGEE